MADMYHFPNASKMLERIALLTIMFPILTVATNQPFSFDPCPGPLDTFTVDGAVLVSQIDSNYLKVDTNCTLVFQTKLPTQTFLVQFRQLDIRQSSPCLDHLSIIGSSPDIPLPMQYCGALSGLKETQVYTNSSVLRVTWATSMVGADVGRSNHAGFNITITAISRPPGPCDANGYVRCFNEDCISEFLQCDGVNHCLTGEDEINCPLSNKLPPPSIASIDNPKTNSMNRSSTTLATTTEEPGEQEIYLWLPLVVVVLFTGLMVFLIMIGRRQAESEFRELPGRLIFHRRRARRAATQPTTELVTTTRRFHFITPFPKSPTVHPPLSTTFAPESGLKPDLLSIIVVTCVFVVGLSVCLFVGCRSKNPEPEPSTSQEIQGLTEASNNNTESSNQAYTARDGRATPPPTYSMIERQTSYVSYISQSPSQISEPPDYDEALDLPGEQGSAPQTRYVGRSVSQLRPSSSIRTRIRDRILNRSRSVQEGRKNKNKNVARSGSTSVPVSEGEVVTDSSSLASPVSEPPSMVSPGRTDLSPPAPGPQTSTPESSQGDSQRALLSAINNLVESPEVSADSSRRSGDPQAPVVQTHQPGGPQPPGARLGRNESTSSEHHYVNVESLQK